MRTFLYGDNEVENFEFSFFIHIPYCVKHERDYSLTWEGQNCENDESSIYSTVQYSTQYSAVRGGEGGVPGAECAISSLNVRRVSLSSQHGSSVECLCLYIGGLHDTAPSRTSRRVKRRKLQIRQSCKCKVVSDVHRVLEHGGDISLCFLVQPPLLQPCCSLH